MIRFKYLTFLILLSSGFISCSQKEKPVEKSTHEVLAPDAVELSGAQYKSSGILAGSIDLRPIRTVLTVNGTVNVTPQNVASVSAPLGGFIKSTNLYQGGAVKKGQVMVLIENMAFVDLQQNYLETKARFQYAEIEFKRHSELYKENVYSEKNVQQTETEYKTLNAQLRALEQKLKVLGIDPSSLREDKITSIIPVIAPISGFLKSVNVNIGKYVGPTDVMFEIVNPDNLLLELVIFEKDVNKIASGQTVTFSTPDDPGHIYNGKVYQAGKALDNDKTSSAYATIEGPAGKLLSGMYVNAKIAIENQTATTVPNGAIVQFDEKFYIFVHKGKRMENGHEVYDFKAVEVKKGTTDGSFTEVILPEKFDIAVKIVIKGAYSILSAWKNAGEMAC